MKVSNWVWYLVFSITTYFILGFIFGFWQVTLLGIIGGSIYTLYLKLTGQI